MVGQHAGSGQQRSHGYRGSQRAKASQRVDPQEGMYDTRWLTARHSLDTPPPAAEHLRRGCRTGSLVPGLAAPPACCRTETSVQRPDDLGLHTTVAPSWFDPAETLALITPYLVLYAIHDALLKPMPDRCHIPPLATRWSESADGLTYDFALRQGVTFHNGDPFTAEDVLFSFARYKGAGAGDLHKRVQAVAIVNAHHVRFRLHAPWPDFLTFYGTIATGAGWIVPKKYIETIGNDAFKQQPIGLGPYRLVRHQPGVELVLEAYPDYWRKVPHVQRLVFKSVPEATTRLAMVKQGEADIAYGLFGTLADEVRRDPTLKLDIVLGGATHWVSFVDQYDPTSPWADKRVRLAANHAVNWPAINDAEMLGYAVLTGGIIPRRFAFTLPLEPYGYDPTRARQLLTEAGYPQGFDAGECSTDMPYATALRSHRQ